EMRIDRRDHQMHVEWLLGDRADRLHHFWSEGDHWHEMAVHHVEVDPVGARGLDRADLVGKLREVRGQDRGRDAKRPGHDGSLLPREVTRRAGTGNAGGGWLWPHPAPGQNCRAAAPLANFAGRAVGEISGVTLVFALALVLLGLGLG